MLHCTFTMHRPRYTAKVNCKTTQSATPLGQFIALQTFNALKEILSGYVNVFFLLSSDRGTHMHD